MHFLFRAVLNRRSTIHCENCLSCVAFDRCRGRGLGEVASLVGDPTLGIGYSNRAVKQDTTLSALLLSILDRLLTLA